MEKIKVTVCTGTTCYVLGNAELLALEEELPDNMIDKVELEGATCLDYCKSSSGKAPFVLVNGKLIENATIPKVIEAIQNEL